MIVLPILLLILLAIAIGYLWAVLNAVESMTKYFKQLDNRWLEMTEATEELEREVTNRLAARDDYLEAIRQRDGILAYLTKNHPGIILGGLLSSMTVPSSASGAGEEQL